jgi:hypothetical protein
MALAYYFSPPTAMTAQQYDEITARLRNAGAGHPPGRSYHACFGSGDNVKVFDVWTSQAAFEKFGQTLMPIMQQMGLDPGQPAVANVHNVIVPPAKKSRGAAKKAAPAKRAPAKKRKAARRAGKRR